jgi:hypothetical protein
VLQKWTRVPWQNAESFGGIGWEQSAPWGGHILCFHSLSLSLSLSLSQHILIVQRDCIVRFPSIHTTYFDHLHSLPLLLKTIFNGLHYSSFSVHPCFHMERNFVLHIKSPIIIITIPALLAHSQLARKWDSFLICSWANWGSETVTYMVELEKNGVDIQTHICWAAKFEQELNQLEGYSRTSNSRGVSCGPKGSLKTITQHPKAVSHSPLLPH